MIDLVKLVESENRDNYLADLKGLMESIAVTLNEGEESQEDFINDFNDLYEMVEYVLENEIMTEDEIEEGLGQFKGTAKNVAKKGARFVGNLAKDAGKMVMDVALTKKDRDISKEIAAKRQKSGKEGAVRKQLRTDMGKLEKQGHGAGTKHFQNAQKPTEIQKPK